jgi:phage tail sheath gpL-like
MPNNFPVAVSPSVRSPGLALKVDLLGGAASPGTAPKRACIVGTKASTGTITANTQLVQGLAGADDVKTYLGAGVFGHLAAKRLFEEYGLALVDLVAPAESAGVAATATLLFDDTTPVTVAQTITAKIAGREIVFSWAAGRTDTQAATDFVTAVGVLDADIPVSAGNGGGALTTVTFTSKIKGTIGNDVLITAVMAGGTGGAITLSGNLGSVVSGTLEADFATALTTISGQEYDYILLITGNTDAGAASATSNVGKAKTKVDSLNLGFDAKLQQIVVGLTSTLSNAKTGAAQHDYGPLAYTFCNKGQSLPAEFGGAEVGARLRDVGIDPAANRINTPYKAQLFGAADLVADSLTPTQVEDALQSGVTPVTYTAQGVCRVSRPITTYFKDTSGNPDDRILDQSRVDGTYTVAKDLRVALPQEFPNSKLSPDLAAGADPLPEGVTEVRDVKAFVIQRLKFWVKRGVVQSARLQAAIDNGTLIVRVNPSDESQCDIVLPIRIVPPLAKFSLVVQRAA